MKKYLSIILTLVFAVSLFPAATLAANIGDVIGYAQPTDIVATINGHQLQSYNVEGYTYICVEDLRYYGFDVAYDNDTRTLSFNRNYGITHLAPQYSNPNFESIGALNEKKNILYTDIVTYANGVAVPAANINGQTIIRFDTLSAFGEVTYDDNRREISLLMSDVIYDVLASFALDYQQNFNDSESWKIIIRSKGDRLLFLGTARSYMDKAAVDEYLKEFFPEDIIFTDNLFEALVENGYPATSVYFEVKNSDGTVIATHLAE